MQEVRPSIAGKKIEFVQTFSAGLWYVAMADYDWSPANSDPLYRLERSFCYRIKVGQQLCFTGPNFGNPRFLAIDGRSVILPKSLAFKIIGRHLTPADCYNSEEREMEIIELLREEANVLLKEE